MKSGCSEADCVAPEMLVGEGIFMPESVKAVLAEVMG
jgi:hypothetical protein